MKLTLRTVAIATSTVVCTTLLVVRLVRARRRIGVGHQGRKHNRRASSYQIRVRLERRLYLQPFLVRRKGLLHGWPWSSVGYSYTGWSDYAARYGIGCTPGTVIKGGDGIMYNCQ